ncbi:hypothetical protein SLA2020_054440 [Shorea laevis]
MLWKHSREILFCLLTVRIREWWKLLIQDSESLPVNDIDLSRKDIFRVWDLNIAAHEEFDLVKQLKRPFKKLRIKR